MQIFSGSANPELVEKIARHLKRHVGKVEISRFPDGETFVKVAESIRGKDVFVVQPICKPPNENLMELLIMIDAMRRASAARITAVLPFYGYARQDRKDQPRVPITAKLVANLLVASGANRILTMDLHAQQIQGFFDIPVDHLYAFPVISRYLREKHLPKLAVVSPDAGGVRTAYAYSQRLHARLAIVAKKRMGPTKVEAFSLVGDVAGCSCVMVDDLTTTAGTFSSAAHVLKKHGAKKIIAAVTHATIVETGIERLRKSPIEELIVTDTVPMIPHKGLKVTTLSVAGLLAEAICRIHENRSIYYLFRK